MEDELAVEYLAHFAMNTASKLVAIKLLHTLIWAFFAGAIFFILYCGISGNVSHLTWWAIGLVLAEVCVLVAFRMTCPLTLVARRYSNSQADNFDIYLRNWLARYNQYIFSFLFVLGLILVLIK